MSEWERICREELAAARYDSTRRYWRRKLVLARYGRVLGLLAGFVAGTAIAMVMLIPTLWT